jgi:3-oxoacyl-[acyl-carrier-protein] synthase II
MSCLYPLPKPVGSTPRVVVTGAGIVTGLGLGWRANSIGFRSGRTAFRPVTLFDVACHRVKTAAEVELPSLLPNTELSSRQEQRMGRASRLLLLAAVEAWKQSGWHNSNNLPVMLGTSAGGMSVGEDYYRQTILRPSRRRNQATRALHYQAQTQARLMAEALGVQGPITLISNACASGSNAIGMAWELIRAGIAHRVLTGGYDALSRMVFSGFDALQAMSPTVCRPFDAQRDGLTLGEGAAVLCLETLESASQRSAEILGEILGYGSALDLHHLTQPQPQGDGALAAMNEACATAGISPQDVDYINAHGTGTPLNDSSEAQAICRWAGARVDTLPVSSTKAGIGHLLGGAGAVEAVVCLMALREEFLPPESSLCSPDPTCRFPIVTRPTVAKIRIALSNSFGFGGSNASLIFRRWP